MLKQSINSQNLNDKNVKQTEKIIKDMGGLGLIHCKSVNVNLLKRKKINILSAAIHPSQLI